MSPLQSLLFYTSINALAAYRILSNIPDGPSGPTMQWCGYPVYVVVPALLCCYFPIFMDETKQKLIQYISEDSYKLYKILNRSWKYTFTILACALCIVDLVADTIPSFYRYAPIISIICTWLGIVISCVALHFIPTMLIAHVLSKIRSSSYTADQYMNDEPKPKPMWGLYSYRMPKWLREIYEKEEEEKEMPWYEWIKKEREKDTFLGRKL